MANDPRRSLIRLRSLMKSMMSQGRLALPPGHDPDRPRTRTDCRGTHRPCGYVGCKYHLYLDVNPETGTIHLNYPDLEPWELAESCSLDVAERGGVTLEEVGEIMNLTRERIRQIEVRGMLRLKLSETMQEIAGEKSIENKDSDDNPKKPLDGGASKD